MITLIGHGYIGTHIAKRLRDFEWISHLESPSSRSRFIINATGYIGYPNVEECERNKEKCMQANVYFPLSLEQKYDVPVLHISTGCVYNGYNYWGWTEEDEPNFNFDNGGFYNGCKVMVQKLLEPYLNKSYLFRIRMPFCNTNHEKNLLYKYERYSKLVDYKNSITGIEDLLNCVNLFVNDRPEYGIYNIVNKGTITTKDIVSIMGLDKQWYDPEEFEQLSVVRRSNCNLSTKKIECIYDMPDVFTAVKKTVNSYRKRIV